MNDDTRLDTLLRRSLAPDRSAADFAAGVHAALAERGTARDTNAAAAAEGEDDPDAPRAEVRPHWFRAAAALFPPVMLPGVATPTVAVTSSTAGMKLGWKALLLLAAAPLAALAGLIGLAFWGLRSLGRPTAPRVIAARARLARYQIWWLQLPLVAHVVGFGGILLATYRPGEAMLLFGAGCIVYVTLVVRRLAIPGLDERMGVANTCGLVLLHGALTVFLIRPAAIDPIALHWLQLVAPAIGFSAAAICFAAACRAAVVQWQYRDAMQVVVLIAVLPLTVWTIARVVSEVARPSLGDRVFGAVEAAAGQPRVLPLPVLVDASDAAGRVLDFEPYDIELARELAEAHPNQFVLRDAVSTARVPPGALENHRLRGDEQLLRRPLRDAVPRFVLLGRGLPAFVASKNVSAADRDLVAANLARSWPEPGSWDALECAQWMVDVLDALGHPELVTTSREALGALLAAHWIEDPAVFGAPGFSSGAGLDGSGPLLDARADYAAARIVARLGGTRVPTPDRFRAALGERLDVLAIRPTIGSSDIATFAAAHVLDRAFGAPAPAPVVALSRWLHVLAFAVFAAFAVAVTLRTPVRAAPAQSP